jgi:ethanolamine utilization microcompartment shell protein EutS
LSAASTQPVTFLIGYDLDGAADVEIGHMNQYGGATTIYGQTVFGAVVGSLTVGVEYVIKITWASDGDSLSCDDPWIGLFTGGSG